MFGMGGRAAGLGAVPGFAGQMAAEAGRSPDALRITLFGGIASMIPARPKPQGEARAQPAAQETAAAQAQPPSGSLLTGAAPTVQANAFDNRFGGGWR